MTGVKLPKAVQAQGEAAEEALRVLKNSQQDPGNPDPGSGEQGTDTADDFVSEAEGQAADKVTPDPSENEQAQSNDDFDWKAEAAAMKEQRDKVTDAFNSLKGKYNAEVPRLNETIRNLTEKLNAKPTQATQPATQGQQGSEDLGDLNLEELEEMYGEDFVKALKVVKNQAVTQARSEFEPRLKRVDDIERQAAQDAASGMFSAIAKEHSDWEQINDMASWHQFLQEINPDTGEPRQAAINRAQDRLDAAPIVRQLSAFKRRSKRGNQSLEGQAVPGSDGRPDPAPVPDQGVYKSEAIDSFFKTQASKISKGIPATDEEKRLDAKYTKALIEGRVR